jgi:hypothetical protein
MGASASVKKSEDSDDEDDNSAARIAATSITASKATAEGRAKESPRKKHANFFTSEEMQEIKEIEVMQKKATAFISKHFFYAVSHK